MEVVVEATDDDLHALNSLRPMYCAVRPIIAAEFLRLTIPAGNHSLLGISRWGQVLDSPVEGTDAFGALDILDHRHGFDRPGFLAFSLVAEDRRDAFLAEALRQVDFARAGYSEVLTWWAVSRILTAYASPMWSYSLQQYLSGLSDEPIRVHAPGWEDVDGERIVLNRCARTGLPLVHERAPWFLKSVCPHMSAFGSVAALADWYRQLATAPRYAEVRDFLNARAAHQIVGQRYIAGFTSRWPREAPGNVLGHLAAGGSMIGGWRRRDGVAFAATCSVYFHDIKERQRLVHRVLDIVERIGGRI